VLRALVGPLTSCGLSAGRYGGAVDVERAADLYGQGWTLRQIGAELGVTATTVITPLTLPAELLK
jgi:hypothetical protein